MQVPGTRAEYPVFLHRTLSIVLGLDMLPFNAFQWNKLMLEDKQEVDLLCILSSLTNLCMSFQNLVKEKCLDKIGEVQLRFLF